MNILFAVLLSLLALVALFVVAEFAARQYLRRTSYRACVPKRLTIFEPDPEILPTLERKVRVVNNSLGERGSEPPRGSSFFKVLCCGGSSMESLLLDQDTSPGGSLEIHLKKAPELAGVEVQVGNVGRSLTDTTTLNAMFRKLLPQYDHIDAIVLLLGASEVARWLELGAPEAGITEKKTVNAMFAEHPEIAFSFTPKGLALRKILGRRRARETQTFKNAGRRYLEARRMRANALKTIEEVPETGAFLQQFRQAFAETLELAKAKAPIVVVARQPWFEKQQYSEQELSQFWHGSVGNAFHCEVTEFYSPRVISALMQKIDAAVEQLSSQMGVPTVDCKSLLPPTLDYYYDQIHFTALGSQIIAGKVSEVIAAEVGRNQGKYTQGQ